MFFFFSARHSPVKMFKSKRKSKKLEISAPTNFCHRVHTDFDERQNKYVGLPLQWVSLVERNAKALETRPRGVVDPLQVTPTDMMDFNKVSGRGLPARRPSSGRYLEPCSV